MKDKSLIESTTEQEINKLTKENKELKAMLKIVAKDISSFKTLTGNSCRTSCEKCLFYNDGKEECKYKYMDEIKKLIGDDSNG